MMTARHKVIILSGAVGFGGATVPSWRSLEYRTVTRSVIFVKKVPCWYTKIVPRSSHPKTHPQRITSLCPPGLCSSCSLPAWVWCWYLSLLPGERLRFQVSTRVCWWNQHSQHSHICWGWPYTSLLGIQTNWQIGVRNGQNHPSSQLHKNQPKSAVFSPGTFDICRRGAWTGGIEMNEDVPITTATSTLWQWEVIWDNHRWKGIVVMRLWMIMMDTAEMMDKNDGW